MKVPSDVEIDWHKIASFWLSDIFPLLFLALLASVGLILKLWPSDRRGALFYAGLLSGALLCGWLGRLHVGGALNVLMPLYAVFAVMMPIALRSVLQMQNDRKAWRHVSCASVHVVALLQLALLSYDPRQAIPSLKDKARSDQILAYLRSIDGRVLIMDDRHFAKLLGNSSSGLDYSLTDFLQVKQRPETEKLKESIIGALREHQFVGVVDPPDFIISSVRLDVPVMIQPGSRGRFAPRFQRFYAVSNSTEFPKF